MVRRHAQDAVDLARGFRGGEARRRLFGMGSALGGGRACWNRRLRLCFRTAFHRRIQPGDIRRDRECGFRGLRDFAEQIDPLEEDIDMPALEQQRAGLRRDEAISITCATSTAGSTPTIRAAPLSECAARISASSASASARSRSSASNPSERTWFCVSASVRKRSINDALVDVGGRRGHGERPLQGLEKQLLIEHADRFVPPLEHRPRVGGFCPGDRRRRVAELLRIETMDALHLVHGEDEALAIAAGHEQPGPREAILRGRLAGLPACRAAP